MSAAPTGTLALLLVLGGCGSAPAPASPVRVDGRTEIVVLDPGPVPVGPLLRRSEPDAVLSAISCATPSLACAALPDATTQVEPVPELAPSPDDLAAGALEDARERHAGDAAWWYGPEHAQLSAWAARSAHRGELARSLAARLAARALDPPGRRVVLLVPVELRALVEERFRAEPSCLVLSPRGFLEG
ncbi:MAG: hypothetical protein AAGH15_04815 [Myxococcota bacterium]